MKQTAHYMSITLMLILGFSVASTKPPHIRPKRSPSPPKLRIRCGERIDFSWQCYCDRPSVLLTLDNAQDASNTYLICGVDQELVILSTTPKYALAQSRSGYGRFAEENRFDPFLGNGGYQASSALKSERKEQGVAEGVRNEDNPFSDNGGYQGLPALASEREQQGLAEGIKSQNNPFLGDGDYPGPSALASEHNGQGVANDIGRENINSFSGNGEYPGPPAMASERNEQDFVEGIRRENNPFKDNFHNDNQNNFKNEIGRERIASYQNRDLERNGGDKRNMFENLNRYNDDDGQKTEINRRMFENPYVQNRYNPFLRRKRSVALQTVEILCEQNIYYGTWYCYCKQPSVLMQLTSSDIYSLSCSSDQVLLLLFRPPYIQLQPTPPQRYENSLYNSLQKDINTGSRNINVDATFDDNGLTDTSSHSERPQPLSMILQQQSDDAKADDKQSDVTEADGNMISQEKLDDNLQEVMHRLSKTSKLTSTSPSSSLKTTTSTSTSTSTTTTSSTIATSSTTSSATSSTASSTTSSSSASTTARDKSNVIDKQFTSSENNVDNIGRNSVKSFNGIDKPKTTTTPEEEKVFQDESSMTNEYNNKDEISFQPIMNAANINDNTRGEDIYTNNLFKDNNEGQSLDENNQNLPQPSYGDGENNQQHQDTLTTMEMNIRNDSRTTTGVDVQIEKNENTGNDNVEPSPPEAPCSYYGQGLQVGEGVSISVSCKMVCTQKSVIRRQCFGK